MRGADINHVSNVNKLTPLHFAIEANLSSKMIKFLIQYGALVKIKDINGQDCCDKANLNPRYKDILEFKNPRS